MKKMDPLIVELLELVDELADWVIETGASTARLDLICDESRI